MVLDILTRIRVKTVLVMTAFLKFRTIRLLQHAYHIHRCFTGIPVAISNERLQAIIDGPNLEDFMTGNIENEIESGFSGRTANKTMNGSNLGQKFLRKPKSENRKPHWLKAKVPSGDNYERLLATVKRLNLATGE